MKPNQALIPQNFLLKAFGGMILAGIIFPAVFFFIVFSKNNPLYFLLLLVVYFVIKTKFKTRLQNFWEKLWRPIFWSVFGLILWYMVFSVKMIYDLSFGAELNLIMVLFDLVVVAISFTVGSFMCWVLLKMKQQTEIEGAVPKISFNAE